MARRLASLERVEPLSPRERQIVRMLANGFSQKEAAHMLAISKHTMHEHMRSVREHMAARTTIEAVVTAVTREEAYA